MLATASKAALLLLLFTAAEIAAAGEGVCPRPRIVESILRLPAAACSEAESPALGGYPVGVVEGCDAVLQRAVNLVLQEREDFVAVLFYASWCPFSKVCRPDFHKMSSLFPTIRHFAFEESSIKPSTLSWYGVRAFPALFLLNSTMRVRYHGSRTINALVAFYKDFTGANPASLDAISSKRTVDFSNIVEVDKKEQENCPFSWARSPERLLQQDAYLALASLFVLLRVFYFLLPKLNACVKPAWRLQPHELRGLFPGLY